VIWSSRAKRGDPVRERAYNHSSPDFDAYLPTS